jgi:hypothetical protein
MVEVQSKTEELARSNLGKWLHRARNVVTLVGKEQLIDCRNRVSSVLTSLEGTKQKLARHFSESTEGSDA